jgi:hypothetical protein
MPRTEKGPLGEFSGKVIGRKKCASCDRPTVVKVNRSGWPYAICPHRDGCGYHEKAQSITAARHVTGQIREWAKGCKERVISLLVVKSAPPVEVQPEREPQKAVAGSGMWWDS